MVFDPRNPRIKVTQSKMLQKLDIEQGGVGSHAVNLQQYGV